MIQEAHVGLGIAGKEGRAAVRSSDYAFAKFKHLKKVLLVHGHWYYHRAATLVQYFFYKNLAAFTAQLYFAFFSSYSTGSLYDSWSLTLYNITFTSLPIFIFGLFEQNLSVSTLLDQPKNYKDIARNRLLSPKQSIFWFLDGVWMSLINYFVLYSVWTMGSEQTGSITLGKDCFGFAVYFSAFMCVSVRLLVQSRHWNWILMTSVGLSILTYLVTMSIMQQAIMGDEYDVMAKTLGAPAVWMAVTLNVVLGMLPYITTQILNYSWPLVRNSKKRNIKTSANAMVPESEDSSAFYINVQKSKTPGTVNEAYVMDERDGVNTRL